MYNIICNNVFRLVFLTGKTDDKQMQVNFIYLKYFNLYV